MWILYIVALSWEKIYCEYVCVYMYMRKGFVHIFLVLFFTNCASGALNVKIDQSLCRNYKCTLKLHSRLFVLMHIRIPWKPTCDSSTKKNTYTWMCICSCALTCFDRCFYPLWCRVQSAQQCWESRLKDYYFSYSCKMFMFGLYVLQQNRIPH